MQYNDKDESEPDTPWKQKDVTSRTGHEYNIINYNQIGGYFFTLTLDQ